MKKLPCVLMFLRHLISWQKWISYISLSSVLLALICLHLTNVFIITISSIYSTVQYFILHYVLVYLTLFT